MEKRGECKMKYEEPNMEIILLRETIITLNSGEEDGELDWDELNI